MVYIYIYIYTISMVLVNQRSHPWGGTRSLGLGRGIRISQLQVVEPPSIPGAVPDPEDT